MRPVGPLLASNCARPAAALRDHFWVVNGDDRSVKIKSLETAKIMKIKWLVLGCIEADFCNKKPR